MIKKILLFLITLLLTIQTNIFAIDISSPAAVVICEETGRILYNKNANEKRKMASLTKLMTAIMLVENCNMNEKIIVDKRACYVGGSEAGINPNDEVTAKDLLYGMLLPSGNDCAAAIAYHIGENLDNFSKLMNLKVREMGLKNTNFVTPHGLDSEEHYTTAYEMALIARYAKQYEEIKKAVATESTTVSFGGRITSLRNTNALLRTYDKATGMKTGFTNGANRCLAASASSNNLNLIAVVLGSDTSQIRFNDAKNILEETFNNYNFYDLSNFTNVYIDIPIIKGKETRYIKTYKDNLQEALTKDEYSKIYVSQNFIKKIEAPMQKGTYIGTYKITIDDEILYSKDFYLEKDILKKTTLDYFLYSLSNMFNRFEKI